MEAQVENNVKKASKQINKEKNRKKNTYVQTSITEKLRKWIKKNIGKKELTLNWCPWPNTQALLYLVPSKELFLILSGLIRHK